MRKYSLTSGLSLLKFQSLQPSQLQILFSENIAPNMRLLIEFHREFVFPEPTPPDAISLPGNIYQRSRNLRSQFTFNVTFYVGLLSFPLPDVLKFLSTP